MTSAVPLLPPLLTLVALQTHAMRASHLLIKHQGSRNPISRRTNQSTAEVTRDSAVAELNEILKTITAANFAQMAQARAPRQARTAACRCCCRRCRCRCVARVTNSIVPI